MTQVSAATITPVVQAPKPRKAEWPTDSRWSTRRRLVAGIRHEASQALPARFGRYLRRPLPGPLITGRPDPPDP